MDHTSYPYKNHEDKKKSSMMVPRFLRNTMKYAKYFSIRQLGRMHFSLDRQAEQSIVSIRSIVVISVDSMDI